MRLFRRSVLHTCKSRPLNACVACLAGMARDAINDARPNISLKGMSAYQRAAVLAIIPSPFRLDLGEMTHDEMIEHLTATSDYNTGGAE